MSQISPSAGCEEQKIEIKRGWKINWKKDWKYCYINTSCTVLEAESQRHLFTILFTWAHTNNESDKIITENFYRERTNVISASQVFGFSAFVSFMLFKLEND